jgi:hypothetical protein
VAVLLQGEGDVMEEGGAGEAKSQFFCVYHKRNLGHLVVWDYHKGIFAVLQVFFGAAPGQCADACATYPKS